MRRQHLDTWPPPPSSRELTSRQQTLLRSKKTSPIADAVAVVAVLRAGVGVAEKFAQL